MVAYRLRAEDLAARQEHIARRFARAGEDHFAGLPLAYEEHAVPVVPAALGHLECQVLGAQPVGDHRVVFGLVTRVCRRVGDPLVFLRGRFGDFTGRDEDAPQWFF
jgi:flavin reductase (DIM6/NTAB) family NADH-FMN oxidoreductase RutF